MRLLADENIALSVITALRADGHDVLATKETAPGARDEEVMKRALAERRVILTHDRDFGNVIRFPAPSHAGVVLIRCRNQSPAFISQLLCAMLRRTDEEKLRGKIAVMTERTTRIYP